jgi:hypothetical protein
MKVDIEGDRVKLIAETDIELMSMVDASRLIAELAVAIELASAAEVETPPAGIAWPRWRMPAPGIGAAVLPDGRELRVQLTPQGWIGYINGEPQNPESPAERKRDAQALVYRILTESNS